MSFESAVNRLLSPRVSSIDEELIYKEKYEKEQVLTLAKALEPKIYHYHGSGQLEDLQSQVDKLTETCGRLLAMLMLDGKFNINQLKTILNEEFEISEMEYFI